MLAVRVNDYIRERQFCTVCSEDSGVVPVKVCLVALIGITEVPEQDPNEWYETMKGVPCFEVEYLLYSEGGDENRTEKDGYYIVYVNVETGAIEQFEYNSALGGWG